MSLDPAFAELNRASTKRMRDMADRLSDEQLRRPVGEHWTVAVVFAHLAFWDRRVLLFLDRTEQDQKPFNPEINLLVNDIALPLWAAVPPREAVRIALDTAGALDRRLEAYPRHLLEALYDQNKRLIVRAFHRNEHLDEAEAALKP